MKPHRFVPRAALDAIRRRGLDAYVQPRLALPSDTCLDCGYCRSSLVGSRDECFGERAAEVERRDFVIELRRGARMVGYVEAYGSDDGAWRYVALDTPKNSDAPAPLGDDGFPTYEEALAALFEAVGVPS